MRISPPSSTHACEECSPVRSVVSIAMTRVDGDPIIRSHHCRATARGRHFTGKGNRLAPRSIRRAASNIRRVGNLRSAHCRSVLDGRTTPNVDPQRPTATKRTRITAKMTSEAAVPVFNQPRGRLSLCIAGAKARSRVVCETGIDQLTSKRFDVAPTFVGFDLMCKLQFVADTVEVTSPVERMPNIKRYATQREELARM